MIKQTEKNARSLSGATSLWGALSCALVCGTLAYIAYLVLAVQPDRTRRLWIPVVVDSNGNQTILGETRQLEFWTPSVKTKDYLSKDAGQISDKEKWQAIDSDDAVLRFGTVLHSNQNVLGYRRVETWGHGQTKFKSGWWWTVNALTNYSVGDLAHTYRDYWKSPRPVLIEVVDNRGSDEK